MIFPKGLTYRLNNIVELSLVEPYRMSPTLMITAFPTATMSPVHKEQAILMQNTPLTLSLYFQKPQQGDMALSIKGSREVSKSNKEAWPWFAFKLRSLPKAKPPAPSPSCNLA